MSQNKLIGLILIVVGAAGLFFGINAANAPAGEISEALTGSYSDKTMIYLVGGAIAAIAGAVMLTKK